MYKMPTPEEFQYAFNFIKYKIFGDYILEDIDINVTTIYQYQEYKYDILLTFANSGHGIFVQLYPLLDNALSQRPIINSNNEVYGCETDPNSREISENDDGDIIVHVIGNAFRLQ